MPQSTDKVIFRREFNRNVADKNDSFFIQLESEESDSPLATVQPLAVSIAEAFSFATPIVTVTFNDGNGAYFNMIKMDTEQKYYLDMGGTKFKSTRMPLKISKIQLKNMVGGKSTQVTFKITFVHSGWSELLNIRHNRSFTKQPYTTTVKTIMGEAGYKSVYVSESSGNYDQIQPHWSNLLFLKWIQDRAISKSGEHFEFGCNIDGEFFFKTIGDIVKDKKSDIIAKKIPTMHMGSYNENEIKREKDLKDNFNVPNFFTDFSSTSFYLDGVVNGSGGIQSFNYDYDSGSFITKNHTLSDSSITQLSDFLSIKTSHEVSKMRVYGGSESGEAIAKSVLSSVALSNEEFRITTDGSINIHIGMIIELLIQNDPNIYRSPYSELHSGFYVVASVNHVVSLGDGNKFVSVVHLARTGFNSKKAIGYAKTKSGKAV